MPPRKKTVAAATYRGAIDAKLGKKENSREAQKEIHHFARSQVTLVLEMLVYFDQPVLSGDDMNTIQVGRPAVSRYHHQRRYFAEGEGYNFRTHDFPHAWAGVKLGGFMLLNGYSYGIPDDSDVSIEEDDMDDMDDMGDDDSEDDQIIYI
jgi:hypothetical protein